MSQADDPVAVALLLARERASTREPDPLPWDRVHLAPGGPPSQLDLVRWATVEPDIDQVRSTRRLGRPITAAKRGLLRLLGQYHADLLGQQVRYNQHLALLASALQDRVDALEDRVRELDGRAAADPRAEPLHGAATGAGGETGPTSAGRGPS